MQMREYVCVGGRRANIQACAKVTFTQTAEQRFDWQKNLRFSPPSFLRYFQIKLGRLEENWYLDARVTKER